MQVTDIRINPDNVFTIQLDYQSQNTVGTGVLWPMLTVMISVLAMYRLVTL